MKMEISWQRLVDSTGQTCDRCACTGEATEVAFEKLKSCLSILGIDVRLKINSIDQTAFSANPIESNRILIDGISLEAWLGGITGQSPCCGPCGDKECRTLTVDGQTYEAIPERLILRAGLLAAAEKFRSPMLLDDFRQ